MRPEQALARKFQTEVRNLKRLVQAVRDDPRPKVVHELRATTRRLRAVLFIFPEAHEVVRALGRKLGHIRELDVAIDDAIHYGLPARRIDEARKKRKRYRKQIQNFLKKKKTRGVFENLAAKAASLKPAQLKQSNSDILHRLRIEVKKLRYRIEALSSNSDNLTQLQRALGRAHDMEVLQDVIGSSAEIRREHATRTQAALRKTLTTRF